MYRRSRAGPRTDPCGTPDVYGMLPIENDYLVSAAEEIFYPLYCEHINSVGLEFMDQLIVVYSIECLCEVKDDDVCLVTYVHISKKSMREFYKLCFAGETFAEAMLVAVKDIWFAYTKL